MKIIFAPHLDDEIIGCYSILDEIDTICYFTKDYREKNIKKDKRYVYADDAIIFFTKDDTIYVPSRYDYHPKHQEVRLYGESIAIKNGCKIMYYSVEMNVPWLEEEKDSKKKVEMFKKLYPREDMKNDKYFLFKSIKSYDSVMFAVVKYDFEQYHRWDNAPEEVEFLRNLHRHKFYVEIYVQQFGDDRDLEYFILRKDCQRISSTIKWHKNMSCEMYAKELKSKIEQKYKNRIVQIKVTEDNENGVFIS